jgi:hypothetical protein
MMDPKKPTAGAATPTDGNTNAANGHNAAHNVSDPLAALAAAHKQTQTKRPTLRVMDVARMVRETPPPVPWRIGGLAIDGNLILLAGREKQGKSMFTQSLAVGVASGETIAGLDCRKGKALIVDAENGQPEIHRRVHALGLSPDAVESVTVVEAEGFNLRHDLGELEALLEDHRPNLLILDSFRSLWPGGDENDPAKAAEALEPLRNLVRAQHVAAVLLHHLGKAQGSAYRGTTAIGSTVEGLFTLARESEDPQGKTRRRLHCAGLRPAPEPDDRWIELYAEADRIFIDEAEPFRKAEGEKPDAPVRAGITPVLLAAVSRAEESGEPIRTLAGLCEAVNRGPKDRTVRTLRDDLLKAGRLVRGDDNAFRIGPDGVHPPTPEARPDAEPDDRKVYRCTDPKGGAGEYTPANLDRAEAMIREAFPDAKAITEEDER